MLILEQEDPSDTDFDTSTLVGRTVIAYFKCAYTYHNELFLPRIRIRRSKRATEIQEVHFPSNVRTKHPLSLFVSWVCY